MMNERQASSLTARRRPSARTVFAAQAVLLAIMAAAALAGCGQKGPLYLPAQAGTAARPGSLSTAPLPPAPSTSSPGAPAGIVPTP